MPWLTLLRRFWPLLAGAAVLLGAWLWHASEVREASRNGYANAQSEYAAELERDRQHRREVDEETEREHQDSLAKVRADAARELRGRSIRCVLDAPSEVRTGQNPGEPAGGAGGEPAVRASQDLRPLIVQRGDACEALRQQLISIKKRQDARQK